MALQVFLLVPCGAIFISFVCHILGGIWDEKWTKYVKTPVFRILVTFVTK